MSVPRQGLISGKPLAAICHGAPVLIATGLFAGSTAACYGKMRQELERRQGCIPGTARWWWMAT